MILQRKYFDKQFEVLRTPYTAADSDVGGTFSAWNLRRSGKRRTNTAPTHTHTSTYTDLRPTPLRHVGTNFGTTDQGYRYTSTVSKSEKLKLQSELLGLRYR